jgi:hypothetical protein
MTQQPETLSFTARCTLAEQAVPDAPYRDMLTRLHGEMLERITTLETALRQTLEALEEITQRRW